LEGLIQSGLTAPGQVIKAPPRRSFKVRKIMAFTAEKAFYYAQSFGTLTTKAFVPACD